MQKPPDNLSDREFISYARWVLEHGHTHYTMELIKELCARLEARLRTFEE